MKTLNCDSESASVGKQELIDIYQKQESDRLLIQILTISSCSMIETDFNL